jgi:hypothetical protein
LKVASAARYFALLQAMLTACCVILLSFPL